MRVPVKIIVNRMVDSAAGFAAESNIQRSDADNIQDRPVTRTPAERSNTQIGARARFVAILLAVGMSDLLKLHALPKRQSGFRILYVARHVIDEFFQRMRAFRREKSPPVRIGDR